jgi:hypothetical protein
MALTSFTQVQTWFNQFISNNGIPISQSPHMDFWNHGQDSKTPYDAFVNGNIPNVTDPTKQPPNNAIPILIKGDGAHSNIVYALSGTQGTLWDPNPNTNPAGRNGFGQMPPGGPYFALPGQPGQPQIQDLIDWINASCPE